jgi:hypothetical protein
MTAGTAFLLTLWIGAHLAIIFTIQNSKLRLSVFAIIGVSLLAAYAVKPYVYDLQMYSVFFNTGFIETHGWSSPASQLQLDPRDTTGEPFTQGFEAGFRLLAKAGNLLLPTGSLIPRFDPNVGDFEVRGPPRSDAMIFLIMVCGFLPLYLGAKRFVHTKSNSKSDELLRMITAGPIILGSVFFLLGSQNSLRQFLGVSIIVLALSMLASRRYVTGLVLVALSAAFHKWAPILGLIGVTFILLGRLGIRNRSRPQALHLLIVWVTNLINLLKRGFPEKTLLQLYAIRRFVPQPVREIFRLSSGEMLSLIFGVTTIALIKGIAILGIFTADIPLVSDLKPYLIMGVQYESVERLDSFIKAGAIFVVFVCSEFFLRKTPISDSVGIRSLRRMAFLFIIPLAVYTEIFSRILILYWAIELVFIMWGLHSREIRARLAASAVFVAYGFAPNAINVLVGPNWLQSL